MTPDIHTLANELRAVAKAAHAFGDTGQAGHRRYCYVECDKLLRLAEAVLEMDQYYLELGGEA